MLLCHVGRHQMVQHYGHSDRDTDNGTIFGTVSCQHGHLDQCSCTAAAVEDDNGFHNAVSAATRTRKMMTSLALCPADEATGEVARALHAHKIENLTRVRPMLPHSSSGRGSRCTMDRGHRLMYRKCLCQGDIRGHFYRDEEDACLGYKMLLDTNEQQLEDKYWR